MQLCSIASSSSGNCIYVGTENTSLLIDVGISKKKIVAGLKEIGIDPNEINGILITHEHSDHIKSIGVISRAYSIPIYATKGTIEQIKNDKKLGDIKSELFIEIVADKGFVINDIFIEAFNISHDAAEPVCYNFLKGDKKISIATDLGCYNDYIKEKLKGTNILFIEANHDKKLLEVGPYPYFLKRRILSDLGHLSNEASGKLIADVLHTELKHIILGHLSKENNFPELAFESISLELKESDCEYLNDIKIAIANSDGFIKPVKL